MLTDNITVLLVQFSLTKQIYSHWHNRFLFIMR